MHTILTFITPVAPERLDALAGLLREIALSPDRAMNPWVPFGSVRRLHFASFVILPAATDKGGKTFGPLLVFENNFDGELDPYLDEITAHAGPGLHQIYSHCVGYEGSGPSDDASLRSYLVRHVVRPNAYHVGNPGRTRERIESESRLRDRIEAMLDEVVRGGPGSVTPAAVRRQVQDFARASEPWAEDVPSRQTPAERLTPWFRLGVTVLVGLLLLPLLPIWTLVLYLKERTDEVQAEPLPRDHLQNLLEREDRTHIVQNHMASITHVKQGWFRQATLWAVLWAANTVARFATKGVLSGIPSIHFAHWSMIDGGRRLLFLTNYDGSWENYLDDFIDKASAGLSAIWSNTDGFPRSSFLGLRSGGARDAGPFKAIARDKQVPTIVWYSAYPKMTVQGIDKNSGIREGLAGELDGQELKTWLRRF